ncbi:HAMP domain-containing sensor histidine kinase [Opitutus sp. GAS368]|uniref:sensor histidine kinase n=1 Tax=Opitutus sp. GAS368 TaxID=1882749 RepID=UPI00087AC511|nr:HAMP domain-containing sensor histidine kinase [Opitutus sp. GAS368]SDR71684.1 Signal transduction histidine kinase [Opitutus sp. GAS368]
MIAPPQAGSRGLASFRLKLLLAMMLVVTAATALALFFAQRSAAANFKRELEREFQGDLAALHSIQEIRHAALAERCRALARRSRIHAALEDNALDLLYPSARDELLDVMDGGQQDAWETETHAFHARFYRFLDGRGVVIPPPDSRDVGALPTAEEALLSLGAVPGQAQTGYLWRQGADADDAIDEVIAMPITSTENGQPVAALVLGFKPIALPATPAAPGMRRGLWIQGRLHLPGVTEADRAEITRQLAADQTKLHFQLELAGVPSLLLYLRLNPGSLFPPAYEVCLYPLTDSLVRQRRLFWQFSAAGGLLLLGAFIASHILARRLSVPVEQLAVDSAENQAQRQRAEAALELTHEELQRSARFSADASHQLKTPVTVLRAGLEELLAGEKLTGEVREEVSSLVHQTFRLTSVIEDLLLLSRMDAGRLQLNLAPVDLIQLIAGWLDDLSALPDPLNLDLETDFPAAVFVEGEKRYTTLILQNLLENARKYNRPGGRIRITVRVADGWAVLIIGNTGPTIPAAAQADIFQRFHRGAMGENLPGHGLGLNLARELARLHHGDLRLTRSDSDWTEFEARFRLAPTPSAPTSRPT